jgi:hypothetical protein
MAKTFWPKADSIEVVRTRASRLPGGGSQPEGFKLSISNQGELIALISAESLGGMKDKLERRSRKKHWGTFE